MWMQVHVLSVPFNKLQPRGNIQFDLELEVVATLGEVLLVVVATDDRNIND